jgi:hypothetical protein
VNDFQTGSKLFERNTRAGVALLNGIAIRIVGGMIRRPNSAVPREKENPYFPFANRPSLNIVESLSMTAYDRGFFSRQHLQNWHPEAWWT